MRRSENSWSRRVEMNLFSVTRRRLAGAVLCAGLFLAVRCEGQSDARLMSVSSPPMGWSSWNSFSNTVNAKVVMQQARALISSGMHAAGYQFVNIDEGWWLGERNAQGQIVVDPKQWPALAEGERAGDMSNIVRFIHGLGLKAGIYTDAGESGCSMYPDLGPKYFHTGSGGHYAEDFLQFAQWGFDYVKVDWCGGKKEDLDPAVQYAEVSRAIARAEAITGRRLYFSLCEWGTNSPWTWAPHVGGSPADIWRTSGDIVAPVVAGHEHADRKASLVKVIANFDQGIHPEAQHTGYYNDPDMMVLGMPGLSDQQNRLHMALWAISGAPLLAGADLTKLSAETLATLTNSRVLAIDQDAAGLQAVKVAEQAPGLQVWSKSLAEPGRRAVLLLNRTPANARITVDWTLLGLAPRAPRVTDAWTGKELKVTDHSLSAEVPAGDGLLMVVAGTEAAMTQYQPNPNGAKNTVQFTQVQGRSGWARIQIVYNNPGPKPRYAACR